MYERPRLSFTEKLVMVCGIVLLAGATFLTGFLALPVFLAIYFLYALIRGIVQRRKKPTSFSGYGFRLKRRTQHLPISHRMTVSKQLPVDQEQRIRFGSEE